MVQLIWPVLSVTVPVPTFFVFATVTVRLKVIVALARKTSSSPFVSFGTRLSAKEMKLTVLPSPLTEGATLLPSAGGGVVPVAWLASRVNGTQPVVVVTVLTAMFRQGLRTKTFSIPFCTWPLKLEASEAKAIVSLVVQAVVVSLHPLMLGDSLNPFPGVVPSGVEASKVVGVQVAGVVTRTPVQVSRK
jgi:hypothetical protein